MKKQKIRTDEEKRFIELFTLLLETWKAEKHTQEELAEGASITSGYISQVILGREKWFSSDVLSRLINILGVTPNYFYLGDSSLSKKENIYLTERLTEIREALILQILSKK